MTKKPEEKTPEEWKDHLTPEQYRITREAGTEPAFTGEYHDTKTPGTYVCVCCGDPLFHSDHKYDSGSGWPSFFQPLDENALATADDDQLGMQRTEARCRRCDAHLGHVFPDGPRPTGLRFCINSAALKLQEDSKPDK